MRLWLASKAAGRPFPPLTADEVLDFMIVEALTLKEHELAQEGQEAKQRESWRKGHAELAKKAAQGAVI